MSSDVIVHLKFINEISEVVQTVAVQVGQTYSQMLPGTNLVLQITPEPLGHLEPASNDVQDLPEFRKLVLDWAREQKPNIVEILRVRGYGTDWAGDTEGGFYSETNIEISYKTDGGREGFWEITGDTFLSLWSYVVNNGHWKAES